MPVPTMPPAPAPSPAPTTSTDGDGLVAAGRQALLDLAAHVEAQAVVRAGVARAARQDWNGRHRDHFDVERANRDARVAALVARCRRLARG